VTPEEIKRRAEQKYPEFLSNQIQGIPFQGYSWPVHIDYAELPTLGRTLLDESKEKRGFGYTLHRSSRRTHSVGLQDVPTRISIDTQADFLKLIGKSREFLSFADDVQLIIKRLPALVAWMTRNPTQILEYHGEWERLLRVCEYFVLNPRPNLYMRELPISIDTKFIENHIKILRALLDSVLPPDAIRSDTSDFSVRYGLRTEPSSIRFRLLSETLVQELQFPADDITIPLEQMWRCSKLAGQRGVLVENKMPFLTLPTTENTFAIWSRGFGVTDMGKIDWLGKCSLYYWGDLDAHGFQILSALRSHFPDVTTFLMDDKTFETYKDYCVEGTVLQGPPLLPYLTPEETDLYKYLAAHNLRLEQERIPHSAVIATFHEIFDA
jgi:hypothetical protein